MNLSLEIRIQLKFLRTEAIASNYSNLVCGRRSLSTCCRQRCRRQHCVHHYNAADVKAIQLVANIIAVSKHTSEVIRQR